MEFERYEDGVPSWVDMGSTDLAKSREFYGALFGWNCPEGPPEAGGYSVCDLGGKTVAGLGPQMNPDMPPVWLTYVNVDSADATVAKVSAKTLQLLHASAKGKFKTTGRYSAATVLGTKWTVADRCDGTLTHDITDSVRVTDFVKHKTITLHAGQSYLAKARK